MSNLLIEETPHQVIPSLAAEIGLNEAIFVQQLHWRIQNNECYYHNNRLWWYHTQENWVEVFPYWSEATVKRIIQSLRKKNILSIEKLSKDVLGKPSDRTNWFSINHESIDQICKKIALEKHQIIEKKKRDQEDGKPIKIKGANLLVDRQKTATAPVALPLDQNDPMDRIKMTQSTLGQNDPMFKENNKKELLSSSKPAEAVFEFDLVLAWMLTQFQNSGWFSLDAMDKAFASAKLEEYQGRYNNPNKGDALSYVEQAMRQRHGIERRSMKAAKARDELNDAVVANLHTQAENQLKQAQSVGGSKMDTDPFDRSWAEGLDLP